MTFYTKPELPTLTMCHVNASCCVLPQREIAKLGAFV